MSDGLERIARVGLAGWVGERESEWETPTVLGTIGDDLYLVEIDASNREAVLWELIDKYDVMGRSLRIELAFFGDAGGFFASSVEFLELWPRSPADVPAEIFIDDRHKAAFTTSDDDVVVSVRHALRPTSGPPRRQLRFRASSYEDAMSGLAREARRLRDDLMSVAQEQAPEKLASLREAVARWPA